METKTIRKTYPKNGEGKPKSKCKPPEKKAEKFSPFERERYYYGKLLTEKSLSDEQRYFNEKRWMLNRRATGWGVLCGLKVEVDNSGDCPVVIVHPGTALDRYGQEIEVCETQRCLFDPSTCPPPEKDENGEMPEQCFYVDIYYKECGAMPAPLPVDRCGKLESECVYNKTRESFEVKVSCYPAGRGQYPPPVYDKYGCQLDCHDLLCDPSLIISEPCPERQQCLSVPLAKVCLKPTKGGETHWVADNSVYRDEYHGYRQLAYSNETLAYLLQCLKGDHWRSHANRPDRRRFVPLLAQTLPGFDYQNGKNTTVSKNADDAKFGDYPARMTTDGENLWVTDPQKGNKEDNGMLHVLYKNGEWPESREQNERPWGIAYDGRHMWVTYPGTGDVEDDAFGIVHGYNACNPLDKNPVIVTECLRAHPKEIVFDGRYLWVSHDSQSPYDEVPPQIDQEEDNGEPDDDKKGNRKKKPTSRSRKMATDLYLSRIDPQTCEVEGPIKVTYNSTSQPPASDIKRMAFDGSNLWVIFDNKSGDSLVKVLISEYRSPEKPKETALTVAAEMPYDCNGRYPEDVAFDGSHIWVAHESGITKVVVDSGEAIAYGMQREDQSALAFDGERMWTGEPAQGKINVVDIYNPESQEGGEEVIADSKDRSYLINAMCYDGDYIWVAATEKEDNGQYRAILHRLLV